MEKRGLHKDKSAQFYLLAAIVIVAIIIGVAGVSNYSKKKTDTRLLDLGEELGIEGGKVLEHGVFSGDDKMKEFTDKYSKYAEGGSVDLFFVFGTETELIVATYAEVSQGSFSIGGTTYDVPGRVYQTWSYPITGEEVTIGIEGIDYVFEFEQGQNFYFVISQEINGAVDVYAN